MVVAVHNAHQFAVDVMVGMMRWRMWCGARFACVAGCNQALPQESWARDSQMGRFGMTSM